MPYGKQYDQDRAAARWRAKSTLSESDFNDWESGVANGADVDRMPRATLPGAKQHEEDDYLTALGRDTGFETSKYKGSPVYQDVDGNGKPKRLGERGPGIYVPEGGAFGGGDMNTMDVEQVAKFDTPQETLQKKFAGRLGKMSADEKELAYRKGRKMDVPAGLSARMKIKDIQDRIDAFGDALAPTRPQMRLPGVKPTGDTFAGGGMGTIAGTLANLHAEPDADQRGGPSDRDADNLASTPLERAGGVDVAFNGRGPLLPSSRASKPSLLVGPLAPPAEQAQPMDFRQKLMQAALAKELGVDIPDERKLAREKSQLDYQNQINALNLRKLTAAARDAEATPLERATAAAAIHKLQKQIEEEDKTPAQREAESLAMEETKAKREALARQNKGELTPLEQVKYRRGIREQARQTALQFQQMGADPATAARRALAVHNVDLNEMKLSPLTEADLGESAQAPIVDLRAKTLQGIAQKAGADSSEDATTGSIDEVINKWQTKNKPKQGLSAATAYLGNLNPALGALVSQLPKSAEAVRDEKMQDPEFLKTNEGRIIQRLMSKGYSEDQARRLYNDEVSR